MTKPIPLARNAFEAFHLKIVGRSTKKLRRRAKDAPKRTKEYPLRGCQPLPIVPEIFLTDPGPSPSRKLHEITASQAAEAMSCVRFNQMEPNGFTPTQFVNFGPKCMQLPTPISPLIPQTFLKTPP